MQPIVNQPGLHYPNFDPVLLHLGPLSIRWYALAYITSLVLGWWAVRHLARQRPAVATVTQVDDFLTWATLGVVLALVIFCRRNKIPLLGFADRLAIVSPMGLGLGRCANFINGELWGRAAPPGLPWSMIFPNDPEQIPRHPSQLYEALMEGVILFLIVFLLSRREAIRAHFGLLTGIFLMGYGVARIIGEFFRQPDPFLGFLWEGATMGQLLSIPMILAGAGLAAYALRHKAVVEA
jgi:phosphatidylglycerol:prolipoprotein diacylglycerol transferase